MTESFSFSTDGLPDFFSKTVHYRCPLFLKDEAYDQWVNPKKEDGDKLVKFLRGNRTNLDFNGDIDRPQLKAGWEKRV